MRVADFIDQSMQLDDPGQLFGLYLNALGEYGVDRVLYSALRNTPLEENSVPGISHCYPADWIEYYMANGYVSLDPVRTHCMATGCAFTWRDMMKFRDLSPEQNLLMNQGEEAGLKDGIAVPFHGPLGELYGVGMASSISNPDIDQNLMKIQVLSTNFHVLFSALHDESRNSAGVKLTPREAEVLKWISVGKSNWAIGEILGISEHGVDYHVRNILKKLDADTRITAVVKGIHAGLVTL